MAKKQHPGLDGGINRCAALHYLYALPSPDVVSSQATKKGNATGPMGSKSKTETMNSYRILKNEAEQKLKNKKRENAPDIISKSVFNARAMVGRECFINP